MEKITIGKKPLLFGVFALVVFVIALTLAL